MHRALAYPPTLKISKLEQDTCNDQHPGKCVPCSISFYNANNVLNTGNVEAAETGEDSTKTSVGRGNVGIGAAIDITADAPVKPQNDR
jgi:hypothetical protein